ncbi:MAG: flagellar biosynthesis protein FlhA [Bacillota bacterium]
MRGGELSVMAIVISTVVMMIVPLPPLLLDLLLTFNITISLTILLISMNTLEPLQFAAFPSILLITTLFRLSLNVSSTRLILLHGEAGKVIDAFGNFVIGGNPVVGFVIFLILIVIQFMVITKGAERVAEVAARFTLDAMPGKQMAIDADLNAGLINDQEAKDRRRKIQREADFYGAMDGASKFVKGDAIAGIIITAINVIGGFVVGMLQQGLEPMQALQRFTLLSVGDGLVSQIPALLMSTATGIIVTRAASDSSLGESVIRQLFMTQPRILIIAAGVLMAFVLIPGLPKIPFILLAAMMGYLGYTLQQSIERTQAQEEESRKQEEIEEIKKPENVTQLLQVDPIELEFGYGLLPLADLQQGGDLLDRIIMIRRQCALEMGLIVPVIRIRDNIQLRPSTYVIKIKGVEVAEGELMLDHFLAMGSGLDESVAGIPTTEPAFGLPALWVSSNQRERAEMAGYTVVDPPTVIITHLTEVIKSHAHELLGRQEVQTLVDTVKQNYPAVVEELIPNLLTLGEVQKVLASLLKEGIPVRDLVTIFETLADYARITKDPDMLTEYVRQGLSRVISKQYRGSGSLDVITLGPQLEKAILDSVQNTDHGSYLNMDPNLSQRIYDSLTRELGRHGGSTPVILASPLVRLYFKRITERVLPRLSVISYNELDPSLEVQTVGMVNI